MQIDPLPQVGHVLRALVRNARDVILINEQHGGVMTVTRRHLLYIDDGAVGDASDVVEPGAAFTLQFGWTFGFAPQERVSAGGHRPAYNHERIETNGIHKLKWQRVRTVIAAA